MFPNIQELNIYIICGKTDLRKGIDGLGASLRELYGEDEVPYDHSLFLFCGSQRDRFKALYWDRSGFVLYYKRYENGHLQWPRTRSEVQHLSHYQLKRLITGLSIQERRTIHDFKPGYTN